MPKTQRKVVNVKGRKMIARVYHFLKTEFEFTKDHSKPNIDLSHLRNVSKRTAEACGVSLRTVERILKEEKEARAKTEEHQGPSKPAKEESKEEAKTPNESPDDERKCDWFEVPWAPKQIDADAKIETDSSEKSYMSI